MTRINSIISPRIKKGQSLYHITKNNGDELNISESTLKRLVMAGEMDAGLIDITLLNSTSANIQAQGAYLKMCYRLV